jgi:DNA-binding SARP family transcriptional activator
MRKPRHSSARIHLLGTPSIEVPRLGARRLERKLAGLLAFLALNGPCTRSRLAGLLWPSVPEATARNNLAQCLRRARGLAAEDLFETAAGHLALRAGLAVDVLDFLAAHRQGRHAQAAELGGELLTDLDYADCPAFAAWLEGERRRLEQLRTQAWDACLRTALEQGDLHAALHAALERVREDPLSEAAHRELMRLYWQAGDRAKALAAYEHCRQILWRELAVMPDAETLALMRSITRAAADDPAQGLAVRNPPAGLLYPPVLAGRVAEIARMEAAWQRRRAIFLAGPPGVGKTRLMHEFLAGKGRFHTFEGHAEERAVPYANHIRTCRHILRAFPGLDLPEDVRRQLSRFLPELGPPPPEPLDEVGRARFFEAVARFTRLAVKAGMRHVAVDDVHCVDLPSLELGHYVFGEHWGGAGELRTVLALRLDELDPAARQAMDWVVERGEGVLLKLAPLDEDGVAQMLAGMAPAWSAWSARLHAHTGGNPLYVVETLKALWAAGALGEELPQTLPVPQRAAAHLAPVLAGLSAEALALARLAAVAGERFTAKVACRLLGRSEAHLAAPWAELEQAGLLKGERFASGIAEATVHAGIPAPLAAAIKERLARTRL